MGICNLNSANQNKFNTTSSIIGEDIAFTDYIQQNGLIRPASVIVDDLRSKALTFRDDVMFEDTLDSLKSVNDIVVPQELKKQIQSLIRINNSNNSLAAIEKFANRLNIDFEVISAQEAFKITKDRNVKGFYQAGKVYFIEGKYTSDTIFHEFAHPIVKALAKENPELFNKLYSDISTEFINNVKDKTGNKFENNPQEFREEVIVQSLEQIDTNKKLPNWLSEILYHIKQFLRGKFGRKINLKNLSNKTTLKEFVDMINYGKEFELDMNFLNEDDFIYFQNDVKAIQESIKADTPYLQQAVQELINEFTSITKDQIQALQSMKGYNLISEGLISDVNNEEILQLIYKSLKTLEGRKIYKDANKFEFVGGIIGLSEEQLATRLYNFISQIVHINKIIDELEKKINFITTSGNFDKADTDDFQALYAATELLTQYLNFLSKARNTDAIYIPNNPLVNKIGAMIDRLNNPVSGILTKANNLRADIVVDLVYDHLSNVTDTGRKIYEKQLERVKNNPIEYNRIYKEYTGLYPEEEVELKLLKLKSSLTSVDRNRLKELQEMRFNSENFTRNEFKDYLMSDASVAGSWMNRMFESYMMNQDKAVGGFYSFITEQLATLKGNINSRENELLSQDKLDSLIKNAGYFASRHTLSSTIGKDIGHLVNIGRENKRTGEIEDFYEWQFQHSFKGYMPTFKRFSLDLEEANIKYKEALTEDEKLEAKTKIAEIEESVFFHNMYFMNQSETDEYYIIESLLYSSIEGRKARWAMREIYDEINSLGSSEDVLANIEIAEEKSQLFRQLAELASEYNRKGQLKTGDDLAIAKVLKEYNTKRYEKEVFKWEEKTQKFRDAYNEAMSQIIIEANGNSDVERELRDRWITQNTTTRVSSTYYDLRQMWIAERDELLKPLKQLNLNYDFDLNELYDKLSKLNKTTKDSSGQYDGVIADPQKLEEIKELHEKIEKIQDNLITLKGKGLTKKESNEFWALYNDRTEAPLDVVSESRFQVLARKRMEGLSKEGIFADDIERIDSINAKLRGITQTEFTTHYVEAWQEFFDYDEDFREGALFILNANYENVEDEDLLKDNHTLTEKDIKVLLDPKNRNDFNNRILGTYTPKSGGSLNFDSFYDWFTINHYSKSKPQRNALNDEYEIVLIHQPTSIWLKTVPSDVDFYESFELLDENGNGLGILEDKHGIPRVPNANYQIRSKNDNFINKEVERDYIDIDSSTGKERLVIANKNNKEQWLPKSEDQLKQLAAKLMADKYGFIESTEEEILDYMQNDELFMRDGLSWDRYINKDYQAMFDNNRPLFDLMNYLKEWELDNQEELNPSKRAYLTYPKLRKSGLEDVSRKGWWKRRAQRTEDLWTVREDDVELGLNRLKSSDNTELDHLDRPISGIYENIDYNEVSTDIVHTLLERMYSTQEYLTYRDLNAFAKTFEYAVTNWTAPGTQFALRAQGKLVNTYSVDKSSLERSKAINSIIDKHFKGVDLARQEKESNVGKARQKATAAILTKALNWSSRKWFMFNPMSGLTNFGSANLQAMYKFYYSGTFMNPKNFIIGHKKAIATLNEYAAKTYNDKAKSAQMQLMDILDASPDKYLKIIADKGSRNILSDLYTLKIGYASRAWMTHEVNYMAMYGLMDNKKHKFEVNGKRVSLDKAVALDSQGRIVTIAGTPKEWSISYDENDKMVMGESVKKLMNLHKGYLTKIHGMGGMYNEGDHSRYLLGKVVTFIFKFLPGMITDRYGASLRVDNNQEKITRKLRIKRRFNYNTREYELGTSIEALRLAQSIIEAPFTGFKKRGFLKEQYKGLLNLLSVYFMTYILSYLRHSILLNPLSERRKYWLGRSDDDSFSRMKSSTGLPDLWMVDPSRTTGFNLGNYTKLQGIRLLLRLERENSTFSPYSLINIGVSQLTEPAALSGAVNDIKLIASTLSSSASTDPQERLERRSKKRSYVLSGKKDKSVIGQTSGPYIFQQKGGDKIYKNIAVFYGLSGNMIDPATAYKNERAYFTEPWNPLTLVLPDPTYQPEPGELDW